MDLGRFRHSMRQRSPYSSRSRSSSPLVGGSRGRSRSSSPNAFEGHDRQKLSPERDKSRLTHAPYARSPSLTHLRGGRERSPLDADPDGHSIKRLRQPEIQSSVHHVPESERGLGRGPAPDYSNPPPITLNERFTRLTSAGTAVYSRRNFGRMGEMRYIPHLIVANNTKLPPATLARQAKAISIVIERKFPRGGLKDVSDATQGSVRPGLYVPRRPGEGIKPVFDRSETHACILTAHLGCAWSHYFSIPVFLQIQFYTSAADEDLISKRLLDCISSTSKSRHSESVRPSNRGQYHESVAVGRPNFYGIRVNEGGGGYRYANPLDPSETPRNASYFLHDDRAEPQFSGYRQNWRGSSRFNSGYRRSSHGSPEGASGHRQRAPESERWEHDKFESEEGSAKTREEKPMPKPVPAPKPILWSTIGKEITNGESRVSYGTQNYSPDNVSGKSVNGQDELKEDKSKLERSVQKLENEYDAEDVQIDVEPVLDETTEKN
ncbi:unnamed protein product [Calicophoron daubneyi]|uniref:Btz domain-containing protein n=1 Tax=Calicophoron daubneyi TaxID=300641 RepID=A0AAV2TY59_CALDB